jgi:hypothetical protein
LTIDAGATDHDIIDNGEATLASYPVALAVFNTAVCQYGSFVELHTSQMELLGEGSVLDMKEVPGRSVDDLVRGVAEDINNGVGRVENMSTLGKVCSSQ